MQKALTTSYEDDALPRFVILLHVIESDANRTSERPTSTESLKARGTHWDLMFEDDGKLLTWALPDEPSPGLSSTAWRLNDHRLAYLDYEGEISGGRGSVTQVHSGEFEYELKTEHLIQIRTCTTLRWLIRLQYQASDSQVEDQWAVQIKK